MKLCDRGIIVKISFPLDLDLVVYSSDCSSWLSRSSRLVIRRRGEDGMDGLEEIVLGDGCI